MRARLDKEADAQKSPQRVLLDLSREYKLRSEEERNVIDALISEWVNSDDETKRFDAVALIGEHRIQSALPALGKLVEALDRSNAPGAPYESAKVTRVIGQLTVKNAAVQ